MLFFPWSLICLSGLCFLCLGFAWGRRCGLREGVLLGQREAPLLLRRDSLLAGHCLLCQQNTNEPSSELAFDLTYPALKGTPV